MSFPGLELGMFPQMARHPGSESSTKAPNDSTEEMAVVPATLVELGEQALVEVADSIARGAPVVQCQLLASGFYEALKNELRDKTEAAAAERDMLAAVAGRCDRIAVASISPGALLGEFRTAVAMLRPGRHSIAPQQARSRPILRVIEGGLSRN
jgi:hypothetical protein